MGVAEEIDRLSRRREVLWAGEVTAESSREIDRITARLADLYEQKRMDAVQASGARRAEIVRRARVESELERLMSDRGR